MGTGGAKGAGLRYILDTSVFIQAWQRIMPPDVAPGFWERLGALIASGAARSPDEVLVELEKKDDEVAKWCKERKEALFLPIDVPHQFQVKQVLKSYPRLVDTRKDRSMCDPWVIAFAKVHGAAVVTAEGRTHNLTSPKIPDVCDAMAIKCLGVWDVIRAEKWKVSFE